MMSMNWKLNVGNKSGTRSFVRSYKQGIRYVITEEFLFLYECKIKKKIVRVESLAQLQKWRNINNVKICECYKRRRAKLYANEWKFLSFYLWMESERKKKTFMAYWNKFISGFVGKAFFLIQSIFSFFLFMKNGSLCKNIISKVL